MGNEVTIRFLGGAQTVTGSKTLIKRGRDAFLVDCGLFQGLKHLRQLNWKRLPFPPRKIAAVLLTHGHLDHTGFLPALVKDGFHGYIHSTAPTKDITEVILEDSASLNEKDAKRANKYGYTKHHPALPLYSQSDVKKTMPLFRTHKEGKWIDLLKEVKFRFLRSGHILGSAFVEVVVEGKKIVFSGDLGRQKPLILDPPTPIYSADYLVLESTYGSRLHPKTSPYTQLAKMINSAVKKQGTILIPSFVVERAQELLFILNTLIDKKQIPKIPIYLDTPMGIDVTEIFFRNNAWHTLSSQGCKEMCRHTTMIKHFRDTEKVIEKKGSKIVIAGSGMITGGRILSYLEHYLDDPHAHILLVGYQAEGTRGRVLSEGIKELKFYGKYYKVRAKVSEISGLSGHADQGEILAWLKNFTEPPKKVFINHGSPQSSDALRLKIQDTFGWDCIIPTMNEEYTL